MAIHSATRFVNTTVYTDDEQFFNCTFDRCAIVYSARAGVTMDHCSFKDCSFAFEGAAGNTISFMTALYQLSPDLVERTFERIRLGIHPGLNPI
jgi:hypothetical protein